MVTHEPLDRNLPLGQLVQSLSVALLHVTQLWSHWPHAVLDCGKKPALHVGPAMHVLFCSSCPAAQAVQTFPGGLHEAQGAVQLRQLGPPPG